MRENLITVTRGNHRIFGKQRRGGFRSQEKKGEKLTFKGRKPASAPWLQGEKKVGPRQKKFNLEVDWAKLSRAISAVLTLATEKGGSPKKSSER